MFGTIHKGRWIVAAALISAFVLGAACSSAGDPSSIDGYSADEDGAGAPPVERIDKATGEMNGYGGDAVREPAAGAGQGTTASDGGSSPVGLPALLDRKIIRTATLTLETDAVSARFEDVGNIAAGAGGYIASSTFGKSEDRDTASVTVRVPADRYQDALVQLRKLGEVKGEQSNANDVSEEFTDLESRLRNLDATERQYLEFLTRAQDINDVLTVQDRLNAVRAEIEQVKGRIQLLDHQSALATITVHLNPPIAKAEPKDGGDTITNPLDAAERAFERSLEVLIGAGIVVAAVAAFSWWIVPLAALGLWLGRRQVRATRERTAPPAAPAP